MTTYRPAHSTRVTLIGAMMLAGVAAVALHPTRALALPPPDPAIPGAVPICGEPTGEVIGVVPPRTPSTGTPSDAAGPRGQVFTLVITPGPGLAAMPLALTALERAADEWRRVITDPITVSIDADIDEDEAARWLGQARGRRLVGTYDVVRAAMIRDASANGIAGALPRLDQLFVAPSSVDPTFVVAGKAVLKALGFSDLDEQFGISDGTMYFNLNGRYRWDFDARDGIAPESFGFEGVVIHEIGHVLGFTSAVDEVDAGLEQVYVEPLDLFRFASSGAGDPTNAEQFTTFQRNLVPGVESHIESIAAAWPVSTGTTMGDGHQASHWKDATLTDVVIGAMDPTIGYGAHFPITAADEGALDLIGWDVAAHPPECVDDGACDDANPHTAERCAFGACTTMATVVCVADAECASDDPCLGSSCAKGFSYDGAQYRTCIEAGCLPSEDAIRACYGESLERAVDLVGCLGEHRARQLRRRLRKIERLLRRARTGYFGAPCPEPYSSFDCTRYGALGKMATRRLRRAGRSLAEVAAAALAHTVSAECAQRLSTALARRAAVIDDTRSQCSFP